MYIYMYTELLSDALSQYTAEGDKPTAVASSPLHKAIPAHSINVIVPRPAQ